MSLEAVRTAGFINMKDLVALEEDADGAWMSKEGKVVAFLPWFTDDPVAEAPLKLIIMLSSCKTLLRRQQAVQKPCRGSDD